MIVIVLALLASTLLAAPEDVANAEQAAQSLQGYTGSAQNIQDTLMNPLMSNEAMSTPDGTRFGAQVGCSASSSYLELLVQPSGTNDIATIMIQQDTTMDGQYDRQWSPNIHASGVCGNGFISCDQGTWDNCTAYKWSAQGNNLMLAPASLSELGGCYCVNNHCGHNLFWDNLDRVLADLGGGAASALAAANPYYAITQVHAAGPTISYSGQQAQNCTQGSSTLSSYNSAPSTLSSDAFSTASVDTTYQLVSTSQAANESNATTSTCEVRRTNTLDEVTLEQIIDYSSGSGMVTPCGPDCLRLTLGRVGDDYWSGSCSYHEHNVRFNVLRPDRIRSATLVNAQWDDWIQVNVNNTHLWNGPYGSWTTNGPVPGRCELSTSWNQSPNIDFTSYLTQAGPIDFQIRVEVTGGGEGYASADILVDTPCSVNPDNISDTCASLESNPQCELVSETIDGVNTIQNSIPTGLTPLSQTQTIVGSSCSVDVTRDWFLKKRVYNCQANGQPNFDVALARQDYVQSNVTDTEYHDRVENDDGSFSMTTNTLSILDEIQVPECTSICKTKKQRVANDVTRFGVVQDFRTENTTWDFFYHECGTENQCPLGEGESVVKACGCIDEFTESATIMQIMRSAGGDTVCSTGIPVPPQ